MMFSGKLCVSAASFVFILSTVSFSQETPWQDIGPYMGYINSMAMDEAHPDTLYAATPYGVYRSFDCAGNWIKTSLADMKINAVQVAQTEPGTLIASSDSVVYKSEDFGETWKEIWKSKRTIGAIAFDPANALGIWAGVHVSEYKVYTENLYHSVNGGNQWAPVPFKAGEELKLGQVRDIHIDRSDTSVIYVSGYNDTYYVDGGLFVSQDGGENWTNFRLGGCSTNNGYSVTTTPAGYEPHAAYVLVNACSIDKQLFRSLDFGKTWVEVWTPFDYDMQRWAGEIMRVDRLTPKWLLVSGRDQVNQASAFYYNDEENKWYYWVGSPHSSPKAILCHPDGNLLGFKNNGVYQNPGGGPEWDQKNRGMADVYVLDIMNYPGDPDKLLVAVTGNLARTLDGGAHWSVEANSFTRLAVHEQDTGIIFGGKDIQNNTFMSPFNYYKSLDGGLAGSLKSCSQIQECWITITPSGWTISCYSPGIPGGS